MDNRSSKVEKFQLPRLDWHDQVSVDAPSGEIIGRIYKDALIENFNAIEEKTDELQSLDVFDITIPDPTSVVYPDTTLESNDNQVINLISLIRILNLEGYPIELSFTGTTCTKCKYYKIVNDTTVDIRTIQNINTKATDTNRYIYLDMANNTVIASNSATNTDINKKFIGLYTNKKVIHQRSPLYPSVTTIKGK